MKFIYLIIIFFSVMGFGGLSKSVEGVEHEERLMIYYDQRGADILYGEYIHRGEGCGGGGMGLKTKLYLFRSDVGLKMLADDVLGAKFGDNGEVYYSQGGNLYQLKTKDSSPEFLMEGVYGDFEVIGNSFLIAVKESGLMESQLVRYDLKSGREFKVVEEAGNHFWPTVSLDGQWVYFMSGMSGVYSLHRVSIHGGQVFQLTNVGEVKKLIGSNRFVPPPIERSSMQLLSKDRMRYLTENEQLWEIDLRSGKGHNIGRIK